MRAIYSMFKEEEKLIEPRGFDVASTSPLTVRGAFLFTTLFISLISKLKKILRIDFGVYISFFPY